MEAAWMLAEPLDALALRQVPGELAKLHQGLAVDLAGVKTELAVGLAEVKMELAEVKTKLAELRVDRSDALLLRTLQGELAASRRQHEDRDAALAETGAALAEKSAALEVARVAMEEARFRSATPAIKGKTFEEDSISWITQLGLGLVDTRYEPHSGDAIVTLPCTPPLRLLIDFKNCSNFENVLKYTKTLLADAKGVDKIDAVMLLYPDATILGDKSPWCKDPCWKSKATAPEGDFLSDRMFVCGRCTFQFAMAQLVQSIPASMPGGGMDPNLHDYTMRISASLKAVLKTGVGPLMQASYTFGGGNSNCNQMVKNHDMLATYLTAQRDEVLAADAAYYSTNKAMVVSTCAGTHTTKDLKAKSYWESLDRGALQLANAHPTHGDIGTATLGYAEPRSGTKRGRDEGSQLPKGKERKISTVGIIDE